MLTPTNTNFFFGLPSKPPAKPQKRNHSNSRDSFNLSKGHSPHSHSLYQFPSPIPNLHLRSQLKAILNKSTINETIPTDQNPQFLQSSKRILNLSYQQNSRSSPKFTPAAYENSKSINSQLPFIARNVFFPHQQKTIDPDQTKSNSENRYVKFHKQREWVSFPK